MKSNKNYTPKFTIKDILDLTKIQLNDIKTNNGIKLKQNSFKQYLTDVNFYLNYLTNYYLNNKKLKSKKIKK